jgi:pilus assembly protein CpaE
VVLLDISGNDEAAMLLIESALKIAPSTHLTLVSPDQSTALLTRAMRAGVREVLPAPMSQESLKLAINHARGHLSLSKPQDVKTGQVIALIPAKGGAGATFLAANLAFALSKLGKQVAVLDLNLYFGDLILFMGSHKVASNLFDLARQGERLDAALLDSSMVKVSENLHILAASDSPEHANEISTTGLDRLIDLARNQYDFVVLDLSSMLDEVTLKALDFADIIYLTMQLNLPALHAAKRIAAFFRDRGYPSNKLSIVVNRYEKGGYISLEDVEKTTKSKIDRTIQNSYAAVSSSVNQGIPILELSPRDPVAKALLEWAQELVPTAEPRKKNWLMGMLSS